MFKRKTTYTIPEGYREHIEATAPTIKYRGNTTIHPEAYISCLLYTSDAADE